MTNLISFLFVVPLAKNKMEGNNKDFNSFFLFFFYLNWMVFTLFFSFIHSYFFFLLFFLLILFSFFLMKLLFFFSFSFILLCCDQQIRGSIQFFFFISISFHSEKSVDSGLILPFLFIDFLIPFHSFTCFIVWITNLKLWEMKWNDLRGWCSTINLQVETLNAK